MTDLNQIIEPRPGPDHRIIDRPAINRAVGPDLDIVFQQDTSKLGHRFKTSRPDSKTKPILPDTRPWQNGHAVPNKRMGDADMAANAAILPQNHAIAYNGMSIHKATSPDFSPVANHHKGADLRCGINLGCGGYTGCRVHTRLSRWPGVEQPRHA
mgnify:CR=1 FL=1